MASELIRPRVTEFLDQMLRLTGRELRFEEVVVPANSPWRDKSLREVPIRTETQLLVVALHEPEGNYVYNPASEHRLRAGASLIVIGEHEGIAKLSRLMAAG